MIDSLSVVGYRGRFPVSNPIFFFLRSPAFVSQFTSTRVSFVMDSKIEDTHRINCFTATVIRYFGGGVITPSSWRINLWILLLRISLRASSEIFYRFWPWCYEPSKSPSLGLILGMSGFSCHPAILHMLFLPRKSDPLAFPQISARLRARCWRR